MYNFYSLVRHSAVILDRKLVELLTSADVCLSSLEDGVARETSDDVDGNVENPTSELW